MLTDQEKILAMSADYFSEWSWGKVDKDGVLHL